MYIPLFVGAICWSLFQYVLFCALSSFAIILARKRELAALTGFLMSYYCSGFVALLAVLWVGLQCMIVVFPDHIH